MRTPQARSSWNHYTVPEIASMLDENYQVAWNQAVAWQIASMTLDSHRKDLAKARDDLAHSGPQTRATPRRSTSTL